MVLGVTVSLLDILIVVGIAAGIVFVASHLR